MEHDKKEIVVTRDSQLTDIQEAFSCFYPFLSIEALQHKQPPFTHTVPKPAPDRYLKSSADIQAPCTIDVSSQRTVSEVVQDVSSLFRMNVQVCRKSGNVWNAVSLTDGWTLERQNAEGAYISGIMGTPPEGQSGM